MSQGEIKSCPGCGRSLRFPTGVGGLTMACPDCGWRFISRFTLGSVSGGDAARPGARPSAPASEPTPLQEVVPAPAPAAPPLVPGFFSRRV